MQGFNRPGGGPVDLYGANCGFRETKILKGIPVHSFRELVAKVHGMLSSDTVTLSDRPADLMQDTGLTRPILGGVELPRTRRLVKAQDPFGPRAVGCFPDTGLGGDEELHRFTLLRKKSEEPRPHFHPGQRVKHRASGVHTLFLKDHKDGTGRVRYSEGDECDHDLAELCAADEGDKAISTTLRKRAKFALGDVVALTGGETGKVVRVGPGFLDVETASGFVRTLAEGVSKSTLMPPGAPVWVNIGSKEVRASVISYNADRVLVEFASGDSAVVDPEQCRAIEEAMLQDPVTVTNQEGRQYRLIPNGLSGLIHGPKAVGGSFSLLKGVRPFRGAAVGIHGGDGGMDDTGL